MARFEGYLLNELFDTKVKVKEGSKPFSGPSNAYFFTIGDKEYRVAMIRHPSEDNWEVEFTLYSIKGDIVTSFNKQLGITGTGDAIEVFSGVIKAIKMWINKIKPEKFWFSAMETSRRKLYLKLAKMVGKMTSKYVFKGTGNYISGTAYEFERM